MEMDIDKYNKLLADLLQELEVSIQNATSRLSKAVGLAHVPEEAITEFNIKFDITRYGTSMVTIDHMTKNYHFTNSGTWEYKEADPIDFSHNKGPINNEWPYDSADVVKPFKD